MFMLEKSSAILKKDAIYKNNNNKRCLGINLIKDIQYLYSENLFKNLIERNTNRDLVKGRDIPSSWIGRYNIVKMRILPYRFNAISTNIPTGFFCGTQHYDSKI